MAEINGEPAHVKLYNLPQRVEGGVKIHGFTDDNGKEVTILFDHLDGMYSFCTIEGTSKVVHLGAATPLIELPDGEYKIDDETDEERAY